MAKGLSLGQLASSVGRTASSVRRWEKDEAVPPADVVDKLAAVLEVDRDELALAPEAVDAGAAPTVSAPVDPRYAMLTPDVDQDTEALATPVAPSADAPAATVPEPEPAEGGADMVNPVVVWLREFWDPEQRGRYYVRAALTAVVLLVFALVLVWALGALLRALGEFWDSIGSSEDALGAFMSGL